MRRATAALLSLAGCLGLPALGLVPACMPDVGTDPVPEALEFDPSGTPARIPEPTLLVVDPQTGRIDLGLAGIDVPEDCAAQPADEIANCEFNQYLESLDGFPSLSPARAPATAALDLATLEQPGDLVVVTVGGPAEGAAEPPAVAVGFEAEGNWLTVAPADGGWDVGRTVVIAVRGYDGGVRAEGGSAVVAAVLTALVKAAEPLTCGAATPAEIGADCPYFALLEPEAGAEGAREALVTLEAYRTQLAALGAWEAVAAAGLPKAEAAALWAFPIHSASVVELDPSLGAEPEVAGPRELRLAVNGPVDATTLTPFRLGFGGTVFLLDLTLLDAGEIAGGVPPFAVTFEDGALVLRAEADLVDGHLYGILITDGVTDPDGAALVPSPVTVLLRATGPLVDAEGHSTVDGVSDADAAELESGRLDLAELLDDELFVVLTKLARADLVYVYAFPFAAPAAAE